MNDLMEAPEEEEDIDLMNDETFGGDIDGMYMTIQQFNNSVYWPIKGPQGATGKLYIHE